MISLPVAAVLLVMATSLLFSGGPPKPSPLEWRRGDKLELVNLSPHYVKVYEGCNVIFIAAIAAAESNDIFVMLTGCRHLNDPVSDVFQREYLRKIYE